MNDYLSRFNHAPASFKKSFYMLVVAWCCHPLFTYAIFSGGALVPDAAKDIQKMAVVSLCLCVLLFTVKKWARALVVMGSAFIVVYDLFWFLIVPSDKLSTILCVMVVLFTGVGSFFLFSKDSRDYYNVVNPNSEPAEPPDSGGGGHRPRK